MTKIVFLGFMSYYFVKKRVTRVVVFLIQQVNAPDNHSRNKQKSQGDVEGVSHPDFEQENPVVEGNGERQHLPGTGGRGGSRHIILTFRRTLHGLVKNEYLWISNKGRKEWKTFLLGKLTVLERC